MRAGPLSKKTVIDTLNAHFVPVYVSIEDYHDEGPASKEEKAEQRRIFREAGEKQLSVGTVHAYVLDPDGHPIDSLHVAQAATGDHLLRMLQRTVQTLGVRPGPTLVEPKHQAVAAEAPKDGSLLLHLVARAEGTDPSNTGWHGFPSEDWIVLTKEEARNLVPPARIAKDAIWEIDRAVAQKVLSHFYPQTENNNLSKSRIDQARLQGTVLGGSGGDKGVVRARLDGSLRMKHPFYPGRDTEDYVDATVVGYIDYVPGAEPRIKRLRLVTDKALYQNRKFDAAVRSVP